jgi:hypothetical protein
MGRWGDREMHLIARAFSKFLSEGKKEIQGWAKEISAQDNTSIPAFRLRLTLGICGLSKVEAQS